MFLTFFSVKQHLVKGFVSAFMNVYSLTIGYVRIPIRKVFYYVNWIKRWQISSQHHIQHNAYSPDVCWDGVVFELCEDLWWAALFCSCKQDISLAIHFHNKKKKNIIQNASSPKYAVLL